MAKITDKRLSSCLGLGGGICPFCGEEDSVPSFGHTRKEEETYTENWLCLSCNATWLQLYDLAAIAVRCEDAAKGNSGISCKE